ncbi:hypothetical protein DXB61_02350 [Parabacteroides merdae]|uniref:Uncharacterized protein n=1 Tax=Parabacteroides merdae TaxID=46503 RepID=A0A3E4ZMW5_9BACT|nr:hypothetical protein DXB85_13525 [Parabacteroides merdae]RGN53729.1 hypothetical protein DXB61_02350 [Parabacteroides merdae]RGZ48054.1 hypothetical protein DW986_10005 [Parabacteroides merdae]RYS84651.1 hypothetical protein EAJ15_06185 [Parabacteroides merdae]
MINLNYLVFYILRQKYIKYSIVLVEQWDNYTKTGFFAFKCMTTYFLLWVLTIITADCLIFSFRIEILCRARVMKNVRNKLQNCEHWYVKDHVLTVFEIAMMS